MLVSLPCKQGKVDSRIFLHEAAAASCSDRQFIVRTNDSDVVMLGVAVVVVIANPQSHDLYAKISFDESQTNARQKSDISF